MFGNGVNDGSITSETRETFERNLDKPENPPVIARQDKHSKLRPRRGLEEPRVPVHGILVQQSSEIFPPDPKQIQRERDNEIQHRIQQVLAVVYENVEREDVHDDRPKHE